MNKEPTGMANGLTDDGDRDFSLYTALAIRAPTYRLRRSLLHQQREVEQW
jgi:hypothetical protein